MVENKTVTSEISDQQVTIEKNQITNVFSRYELCATVNYGEPTNVSLRTIDPLRESWHPYVDDEYDRTF